MSTLIETTTPMIASVLTGAFPPPFETTTPMTATVLAGAFPLPLPEFQPEASLIIAAQDFHCGFIATLIDITSVIDSTVIAKAILNQHINITLTLKGKLVEDRAIFQVKQTYIQPELAKEHARADFVASTFAAWLSLAKEVNLAIPEIGLDLKHLNFDTSLIEISRLLQTRQTAYRLMVIERVTGIQFALPKYFSVDEMSNILFTYYAIVDRSFNWQFESQSFQVRADQDGLNKIIAISESMSMTFPLLQEKTNILGKSILLGDVKVSIEDILIENFDEVKKELESLDNHEVEVVIRSVNGQARVETPDAPRLPDNAWDSNIQGLVDLESQLDARLVERYHALAAATLEGLTEEEKAAVITRPELDEEAFVIEDWNKRE